MLLAITLVPAILGFAGVRVAKGRIDFLNRRADPFGQRWARISTAKPWLTVILQRGRVLVVTMAFLLRGKHTAWGNDSF